MRKLASVFGGTLLLALAVAFLARDAAATRQAAPAVNDSLLAPVLTASDSAALKGPRQPIFFRHDIHAGQFKINCQYCHYSVSVSSEPGIPSMATCMNCHLVIGGTDSSAQREIAKVRDAFNTNTPVEWSRVYFLARHAHFPHMRHINAMGPNACATCHGDVTRTPQVFKVNNVNNMGFCINCHLERNVSRDCSVCHY
jgi:Cytochrome c7 and related cytochrome c/Class III cytochrome C family